MTLLIGSGSYDPSIRSPTTSGCRIPGTRQKQIEWAKAADVDCLRRTYGGIIMLDVKRGQIFYTKLESVVGSEQGGTRPVLILQNDKGNRYCPTTIVATITSRKEKGRAPVHIPILTEGLSKESVVHLEQIRTIDKQRLLRYVAWLDDPIMQQINRAIEISLGLKNTEAGNNDGSFN